MCKRGKGNVRDRFRNLQQQEQTIENQDNMSLMGRETLHIQKQIMIIATMTMMEQISRSTSTCTTEAGVGCSRSAESIGRVLLLLAKSSTSIAESWRRNKQVEKLVEIEFRSVMHAIIIAIHHRQNRRKKYPPARPPTPFAWRRNLKTTRSNHITVESIPQDIHHASAHIEARKRKKEKRKRKKEINTAERKERQNTPRIANVPVLAGWPNPVPVPNTLPPVFPA